MAYARGVDGATGYAGAEVLRLALSHPDLDVVLATGSSSVGKRLVDHVPALAAGYPELIVEESRRSSRAAWTWCSSPCPTERAKRSCRNSSTKEFRSLISARTFDCAAPRSTSDGTDTSTEPHPFSHGPCTDWWSVTATNLPARLSSPYRAVIRRPASSALGPFIDAGAIARDEIVVNALSGASGAGRATSDRLHFSRLSGNAEAYGLLTHRHTPEMQQELGATLLFTPHLVPVSRGMLVSAYGRLTSSAFTTDDAVALLRATYADDPFVVVTDDAPTLKDPLGSNLCLVSARVDERTGWLLAMSSLDNLGKGAAGQAIQAWNVATGRDETLGLPLAGVTP